MKSCYHGASLHCPPTPFIVFLMLYKYNSLKKQKRVLPPNEISSNYRWCIIVCILWFVDESSSTELSVGVSVGSLVACFIATAVVSTFLQMIIVNESKVCIFSRCVNFSISKIYANLHICDVFYQLVSRKIFSPTLYIL